MSRPSAPYRPQAYGQPFRSLGFYKANEQGLFATCRVCRHMRSLWNLDPFIERLGPEADFLDAANILGCGVCGSRDVEVTPRWPYPEMGLGGGKRRER